MKQIPSNSNSPISSLPFDIAIKIASSLEVLDVCAWGSCSRLWRELCASDFIWEAFTKERWSSLSFLGDSSSSSMGWRETYVRLHEEMASKATAVIEFVEEHSSLYESLDIGDYSKAIHYLLSMELAFTDVEMFLFNPKLNVLLNLIGLHYCIFGLKVPAGRVMKVLLRCKISERQVSIRWWRIGRRFFGFHMREEPHSRRASLADLTTDKGEYILRILQRGAMHEVLRVEISISDPTSTPRPYQSS